MTDPKDMKGDRLDERVERWHSLLVKAGRRLGIRWLVYNPVEFYRWHVYGRETKEAFATALLETFPGARSYADVGAGTGDYAAELRRRGVDAVACEHALFGRLFARWQRVPVRSFDLARPEPARLPMTDVAYCLEVGEHVPPALGDRLVAYLSRFPLVLFTAAHPGQGGFEHINEQPKGYWIERFEQCGMHLDRDASDRIVESFERLGAPWWLIANAIVFRRSQAERRTSAAGSTVASGA